MTYWLHWIGKQYYTIEQFVIEAQKYGITRRIPLRDLKKFSWGDIVFCIQKEPQLKTGSVFGSFQVTLVSGLSTSAVTNIYNDRLESNFAMEQISPGGNPVERECGDYIEGPTYAIEISIKEFAHLLDKQEKNGIDIGKIMVGCKSEDFKLFLEPWTILKDVPFRQGFREFDYKEFFNKERIYKENNPGRRPIVKGQLYQKTGDILNFGTEGGNIQSVEDYNKRE